MERNGLTGETSMVLTRLRAGQRWTYLCANSKYQPVAVKMKKTSAYPTLMHSRLLHFIINEKRQPIFYQEVSPSPTSGISTRFFGSSYNHINVSM